MKHKWYNEIMAMAEGKVVEQSWHSALGNWTEWTEVHSIGSCNWDSPYGRFRVKTEPHKFQYLVDAANAGKTIQYKSKINDQWWDIEPRKKHNPLIPEKMDDSYEWRIKPDDIVVERRVETYVKRYGVNGHLGEISVTHQEFPGKVYKPNVRFIFDGDTQQLKNVEFIKE